MRVAAKGMTVEGLEGKTPPLPFVEVEDGEARALAALYPKNITLLDEIAEQLAALAPQEEPAPVEPVSEPVAQVEGEPSQTVEQLTSATESEPAEGEGAQSASEGEGAVEQVATDTASTEGEGGQVDRAAEIASAVELLGEDDFVKTGDRAGKPKVVAVSAIVGFDVTADEVDAAIAAKAME